MPQDSISRDPSAPRGESFSVRSFRRTYPLVAAGHLLVLLLFLLLAKFVSSRPAPPSFFSPISVGSAGSGAAPSPPSRPLPEGPPLSSSGARSAEPVPKRVSPQRNVAPAVKPPPSPSMVKKRIEPSRKPSIHPNLEEVTRTLHEEETSAKPPLAMPHRAEPSTGPVHSRPAPPGTGQGGGAASGSPSALEPNWYYSLIRDRLYAAWEQPLQLSSQNLAAKVQIFVAKDGRVSKPVLLSSSDNEEFDRTVLAAAHQVDSVGEPRPSDVPEIVTVTFRMVH